MFLCLERLNLDLLEVRGEILFMIANSSVNQLKEVPSGLHTISRFYVGWIRGMLNLFREQAQITRHKRVWLFVEKWASFMNEEDILICFLDLQCYAMWVAEYFAPTAFTIAV